MNIQPLSNHVFIEPTEEEKTTKSGIVIPETADKEKPIKGKVLAVGPGKLSDKGERIAMSVKVGDMVLFKKYGPDEIEIDGKKYLVGDEDDILAILEDRESERSERERIENNQRDRTNSAKDTGL